MTHFLDNLSDAIMGAGALIVTIIIILFIRLFGGLKEDREKNTKLTKSQILRNIIWIIILSTVQVWAFIRFTN